MRPGRRYLMEPVAAPAIWILYFMVVYLFVETACAADWTGFEVLGLTGVGIVTTTATLGAMAAITWMTVRSWRKWRATDDVSRMGSQTRALGLVGLLSGILFLVATLAVAVPAIVLPPC